MSGTGREPGPLPHAWTGYACLDLVNSRWTDHLGSGRVKDRLPLPEWRHAFFGRWSRLATGVADAPEAVAGLRTLRGLLRRLLETFSRGEALAAQDVMALNRVLAASPRARRLEAVNGRYRLVEAPDRRDKAWALAEVAASAAKLLDSGEPARLRVCANPGCSWMFYDESRSGSRHWCEGGICGNLVKVRRHRARAA
jgi:predicted RNA-binding Zn ribbon-like protein